METIPKSNSLVTLETIEMSIRNQELVILDFSAPWCNPCKQLEPFLKRLGSKLPHISFYKIDVSDAEGADLSDDYEIGCLPTVCFLYQGELVYRHEGFTINDDSLLNVFSQYVFKYDKTVDDSLSTTYLNIRQLLYNDLDKISDNTEPNTSYQGNLPESVRQIPGLNDQGNLPESVRQIPGLNDQGNLPESVRQILGLNDQGNLPESDHISSKIVRNLSDL
jgi:thioredoxin 1